MKLNSVDHGLFKFNIFKKFLRLPYEKGTKNLKILKKVSRFLDYPNLLRFFQNRKKNLKIICSEKCRFELEDQVHSPLWCQSKFIQILITFHREKSKDSAL